MRSEFCFITLLLFIYFEGISQSQPDSLKRELAKASTDDVRIGLYHQLAVLHSDLQPDEALAYELQALTIAEKGKHNQKIAETHTNIGIIHRRHSAYRKAIQQYTMALKLAAEYLPQWNTTQTYLELGIAYLRIRQLDSAKMNLEQGFAINKKFNDKQMEAQLHNMSGNVAKDANEYKDALEHYIHSAKLFESLNDSDGLTQAVSNIGNMHYLMGNYKEAETYALQSLKIAESISKKMSIAYSNRLLGRIYRKQQRFDESLQVYFNAIKIYQELDVKQDIGETHLNTGNIYFEKGDFKAALREYFSAIQVERQIQDTFNMAYAYSAIGQTYQALNDIRHAKIYLDTSMLLGKLKKIPALEADLYDILSVMYADTKNYKLAYDYHLKFTHLNDSLAEARQHEQAEELAARYESEKKENEIRALNVENEITALQLHQRNDERKYLVAFSILSLILIAVIYNRYKIKSRTTEKLKELDEMKSRFFANLSHEFRTPLSLIVIPLEKKLTEKNPDQQVFEVALTDIEMMYRNASRLQMMINQLLDLSKIESGKMQLHISEGDLARLIRLIHASFESLAAQKGIEFELTMADTALNSFFDPDKIEKIVYNLLSNAFKFTPPGGKVSLAVSPHGQSIMIAVCDTGIGISSDKLAHIFNRFYQSDDSIVRSQEGSGIGLALAKELAELHHGKLTATSRQNVGSEFILSFPIHAAAYKHDISRDQAIPAGSNGYPALLTEEKTEAEEVAGDARSIVLIAEDHVDMRTLIRDLLQEHHQVILASNGQEAWIKACETVPDIVVCDIMMPEMDGITLCRKLKTHEATSHIPVIMLTARGDQESRLEGLEKGADDYLIKPFHPKELVIRVTNLITQRKKLRERYRQEVILRPKNVALSQPENVFIQKVMEVLEQRHINPEFGLDEFGMEMGMSRMQLHRKLKALTDKSPGEFLREFRMVRARQLLSISGSQVSEVAYQVGYNNLSHFAKTFREYTGCTPSEYYHTQAASSKKLSENT